MAEPAQRLMPLVAALLAALSWWWFHFPVDSISLESGQGMWPIAVSMVAGGLAWFAVPFLPSESRRASLIADGLPVLLAVWMAFAAWYSSRLAADVWGNWRQSSNEMWWWIAAASLWIAGRRVLSQRLSRSFLLALWIGGGTSLALQTAYDHFIANPEMLRQFEADPERFMRELGVPGAPGSASWMVAENRLRDGGATATFALANSLAAVLVTTLLLSIGFAISGRRSAKLAVPVGVLLAFALFMTASRTAIVSGLVGVCVLIAIAGLRRYVTPAARAGFARWRWGPSVVVILGVLITASIAFGRGEWVDSAGASVATRFQYWRTTLELVADHPAVGAGPGNFQSQYEHYRDPRASEQIADPHHFLVETLASGGLPAFCLLVAWLVWVLRPGPRRSDRELSDRDSELHDPEDQWDAPESVVLRLVIGTFVGALIVWMFWFADNGLDQAHVYLCDLVGLGLGWWLFQSIRGDSEAKPATAKRSAVALVAWGGLTLHLSFSGGMTVPGIAMLWWLLPASWRSDSMPAAAAAVPVSNAWRYGPAMGSLLLVATCWWGTIRPIDQSGRWIDRAIFSQSRGDQVGSRRELQRAMESDPWSRQAAGWTADAIHWAEIQRRRRTDAQVVTMDRESRPGGPDQADRWSWADAAAHACLVAGESAVVHREMAHQAIHLYQRHGQRADLESAVVLLRRASRFGPSDERTHAQLAVVLAALGDPATAAEHARRARELSAATPNPERDLDRILVYQAVVNPARVEPQRRPAGELLDEIEASRFSATPGE